MSLHDYDLANANGATFRADANNALLAIVSQNSNATEPTTMFAYQNWADTTSGYLKQRNAANTGWIIKSKLSSDMIAALQKQEFTAFTTSGTSTAYTLTTTPVLSALTTNECYNVTFHTASGATPTMARDGLTAKLLKQYDPAGAKVTAVVTAGLITNIQYDGTDYIVLDGLPTTIASSLTSTATGTTQTPQDNSTKIATTAYVDAKLFLSTAVATTSGTAVDFTGIPSWVKRITVMLNGVSTNGISPLRIQLGGGSVESSGYIGYSARQAVAGNNYNAAVSGFELSDGIIDVDTRTGSYMFNHFGSNLWIVCGGSTGANGENLSASLYGSKTTASTLDRIRLTTVNGTDTFDAGSAALLLEG